MKKVLISVVIVAAVGLWFSFSGQRKTVRETPAAALSVHAVDAKAERLPFVYGTVGTVTALQKVVVQPQISGKLTKILFKEGDFVKKGDVIAEIDDAEPAAELSRVQANLTAVQARLREAEKNLKRLETLKQSGFASQKNWDEQTSLCVQLRAAVESGKAQVETARINKGYTKITAPISGRAGFKAADAGNIVSPATTIATIVQTDPVSVVFSLPQSLFSELENNENAVVEVKDGLSGAFWGQGKIAAVDNAFNPQSGTVRVRAVLDNKGEKMRDGQSAAIDFIYGENTENVVLPNKAVRPGLNGEFVFKIENGKAVVVPVQTGYRDAARTVVLSGVRTGDLIVADNFSRLKSGTPIEIAAAGGEQ